MCGIAGILSYAPSAPAVDERELLRMREQMLRRGPDGAGLWLDGRQRIGLAHRRLAIIDPRPEGAQPMASACGRLQLVFNGEIYNFQQLRAELQREGCHFVSQTDTEVLLHLYLRDGERMCDRLRGMFAFAIWDSRDHSLLLGRDVFGIKPLYLHDDGRTLRFASQVKALMAGGAISAEPEPAGHVGYWIWGHVPEPWSLYRGLVSLAPGSTLRVLANGSRQQRQFSSVAQLWAGRGTQAQTQTEPDDAPSAPAATGPGALREAVLDSVRHHLIADVPVGVFLSAGIDSATIAALAAECGGQLRTVTLGFEEYRGSADDETVLAEAIAKRYGAQHQTVWISRKQFEGSTAQVLADMDQPSIDGLNTWLVAQAAAGAGLKVALSGVGGDEFFGGYPSFRHVPRMRAIARPLAGWPAAGRLLRQAAWPLLKRAGPGKLASLFEYGGSWEGAYLLRRAVRLPWKLTAPATPGHPAWQALPALDPVFVRQGLQRLADDTPSPWHGQAQASPHQIVSTLEATRYMRSQLLRDADWAGMAHSVEIRVPLVDSQLLAHLAHLCQMVQTGAATHASKADLAGCARPPLPVGVVRRPKTGFNVPVVHWLQGALNVAAHHAATPSSGIQTWQETVARSFESLSNGPF